jgi:hypothetical protein
MGEQPIHEAPDRVIEIALKQIDTGSVDDADVSFRPLTGGEFEIEYSVTTTDSMTVDVTSVTDPEEIRDIAAARNIQYR